MWYNFLYAGSSTDLLATSDKATQDQVIDSSEDRTDPIPVPRVETGTSSSNTAAGYTGDGKDVTQLQPPPRSADEAKTASEGVAINTSEAGSLEEDWVNVSLSPNHPLQLQSGTHPLENSGD